MASGAPNRGSGLATMYPRQYVASAAISVVIPARGRT